MKITFSFVLFYLLFLAPALHAQELELFDIQLFEKSNKESFGFISLSEIYTLSAYPDSHDSLAMPHHNEIKDFQYIKLESTYRERFLSRTNISETDKVFIYDYATDIHRSFKVKDLQVAAYLNIYTSPEECPCPEYYYMIGFEIKGKLLKGFEKYFNNTFAYVGKESPFVRGHLKPIVWETTRSEYFPYNASKVDSVKDSFGYGISVAGNSYKFEVEGFQYFIQDMIDRKNEVIARILVVIKPETKEIVCEKFYSDSEGTSLAPLREQWTGKLFKNKPPVVFGFEYHSFGCPGISFLDRVESDIYINCDNRH